MKTKPILLLSFLFSFAVSAQTHTWTTNAPTITAGSAYLTGQCLGGVFTNLQLQGITGFATPQLDTILLEDIDGQIPNLTLLLFSKNPVTDGWVLTDHVAAVGPANPTVLPVTISILSTDWLTFSLRGYLTISDLHIPIYLTDTGFNLYGAFVVTSTPTYSTTKSLRVETYYKY